MRLIHFTFAAIATMLASCVPHKNAHVRSIAKNLTMVVDTNWNDPVDSRRSKKLCRCAAKMAHEEWGLERVARFDAELSKYVSEMTDFGLRFDLSNSFSNEGPSYPAPSEWLAAQLKDIGEFIQNCEEVLDRKGTQDSFIKPHTKEVSLILNKTASLEIGYDIESPKNNDEAIAYFNVRSETYASLMTKHYRVLRENGAPNSASFNDVSTGENLDVLFVAGQTYVYLEDLNKIKDDEEVLVATSSYQVGERITLPWNEYVTLDRLNSFMDEFEKQARSDPNFLVYILKNNMYYNNLTPMFDEFYKICFALAVSNLDEKDILPLLDLLIKSNQQKIALDTIEVFRKSLQLEEAN